MTQMPEDSWEQLSGDVARLRRQVQFLRTVLCAVIIAGLGLALWNHTQAVYAASTDKGILHVRGLIVEDQNGVERLRLGAPLPDPRLADGKRHPRSGPISGMIISDKQGVERGSFVTDDIDSGAFLSLDSQHNQEVLFLANKDGGTNLDLFDKAGNEAQMTVFPSGPKLVLKKEKRVVAQLPLPSEAHGESH